MFVQFVKRKYVNVYDLKSVKGKSLQNAREKNVEAEKLKIRITGFTDSASFLFIMRDQFLEIFQRIQKDNQSFVDH